MCPLNGFVHVLCGIGVCNSVNCKNLSVLAHVSGSHVPGRYIKDWNDASESPSHCCLLSVGPLSLIHI